MLRWLTLHRSSVPYDTVVDGDSVSVATLLEEVSDITETALFLEHFACAQRFSVAMVTDCRVRDIYFAGLALPKLNG